MASFEDLADLQTYVSAVVHFISIDGSGRAFVWVRESEKAELQPARFVNGPEAEERDFSNWRFLTYSYWAGYWIHSRLLCDHSNTRSGVSEGVKVHARSSLSAFLLPASIFEGRKVL